MKTNRSEFTANLALASAPREVPAWQRPAPKRVRRLNWFIRLARAMGLI